MIEFLTILCAAFATSYAGIALTRRYALAKRIIDIPNERSSHVLPTPRGGGIGIVVGFLVAGVAIAGLYSVDKATYAGIIAALFIAGVGWVDDRRSLSALARLGAHFIAAGVVVFSVGGVSQISLGNTILMLGLLGTQGALVWIVWSTNLFNFMDGSDGIAAQQAMFILSVMGIMCIDADVSILGMLMLGAVAALLAFLRWNWAPAKIFMGDVGSGFLGFVIASFAVLTENQGMMGLAMGLLLNVLFVVDATCTLLRRIVTRENIFAAHRTHLYQRLLQAGMTHGQVAAGAIAINVAFVLPLAVYSYFVPTITPWAILGIYASAIIAWSWGNHICVSRLEIMSIQKRIA